MTQIEGLPEGLEIVRVGGIQDEGEYALISGRLHKPIPHSGVEPFLVVRVSPGYCAIYDKLRDDYSVFQSFAEPRKLSVYFQLINSGQADLVDRCLNHLKSNGIDFTNAMTVSTP